MWKQLVLNAQTEAALLVAAGIFILLVILVASFLSRPRVFCQYLHLMTGIRLRPAEVKRVYRAYGKAGVRDLLTDLIIQEDLADPQRRVEPGGRPDTSVFEIGDVAHGRRRPEKG